MVFDADHMEATIRNSLNVGKTGHWFREYLLTRKWTDAECGSGRTQNAS